MHVRFLLGPAGSGKTFRCLGEIRTALAAGVSRPTQLPNEDKRHTDGTPAPPYPLVLLAPKQATFQLERQLLADGNGCRFHAAARFIVRPAGGVHF